MDYEDFEQFAARVGINLRGFGVVIRRHPEITLTTKYGNWTILHAAHVSAVDEAGVISPELYARGVEIHDALDEAMGSHSSPPLSTNSGMEWDAPLTVVLDTLVLVQCMMSLHGVRIKANLPGVQVHLIDESPEEDASLGGSAEEVLAIADESFRELLRDIDPEFPLVLETLYEEL